MNVDQLISDSDSNPTYAVEYPIACRELSFILREAFHQFPKNLQSIVFQDTLSAFRLLPQHGHVDTCNVQNIEHSTGVVSVSNTDTDACRIPDTPTIQTQSAVSAVHSLLQSVEAALPKQKKNVAVTKFKHAMVVHKRRCSLQLPQDILAHIFSFLEMKSLVSMGLVCWSWNIAANDNHLWEKQYVALYGNRAKPKPAKLIEGKNDGLLLEPVDTRIITDWKESVKGAYTFDFDIGALARILTTNRGYCGHYKSVVWLNNAKCPNAHFGISEIQDIRPVTAFQMNTNIKIE
uniref:F-box domain-containing protein n=1 Tax=Glycine max TaxID=3847 RepID=A0A0R0ENH2_SOYBN